MIILTNETVKDVLKIVLILIPFIFVLAKGRLLISKDKRFLILIIGFVCVILGFILDFTGDFPGLRNTPFFGSNWAFHELMEDLCGMVGFLLFMLGISTEVVHMESLYRENMRLIGQLNESNKKLKRINEAKSAFIATVSHELCASLSTSKLALANYLRSDTESKISDTQHKMLGILSSSLDRLIRIVEDLLDLAKIESGKVVIRRELLDVCKVVDDVVFSQGPKLEAKKLTIVKDYKDAIPSIWADKDKVIQIVLNILSNAIKYTPEQGRITVKILLSKAVDSIQIEIVDTGPGIPAGQKEKIFDRFESKNLMDKSSSGLGLSIARELVELHNGRIWVESESGKGSVFTIMLPQDKNQKNVDKDYIMV